MARRLLLFLSADHLHAQVMENGKITAQRGFSDSPGDHDNFGSFIKTAKYPAYLLTDLIEEDFRHELIPHLIGRKRSALLQRKFDQFYRNTPFHHATLLRRQKTGRRDDDMLFSALTNPSLITPWLNIMLAQQIPIAGIYSVPQISAPLVKDHPSDHLLLISWEKYSGLRQTYFSRHRLQISRLTPLSDEHSFQDTVIRELSRTYEYLRNLSLLPQGQILDIRLLGHSHDLLELQLGLPRNPDMRYDFIDLKDMAEQLKISYHFVDSDASQIFLHQLASAPPRSSYAKPEHTHYHTLEKLRYVLNLASTALLLGSLLWSGAIAWQSIKNEQETVSIQDKASKLVNEAQQITLAAPDTDASASDVKSAVFTIHAINRLNPAAGEILHPISTALDLNPEIVLDEFSWQTATAEPAAGSHTTHIIMLHGRLTDPATGYRTALDYLDRFEHELTRRGYRVTALKKPLDISTAGNISDVQHDQGKNIYAFSLKLYHPAAPEQSLSP